MFLPFTTFIAFENRVFYAVARVEETLIYIWDVLMTRNGSGSRILRGSKPAAWCGHTILDSRCIVVVEYKGSSTCRIPPQDLAVLAL